MLDIAFNSRYFLDGIKYLNSEYVSIEFLGAINPCVIKPIDDIEYTYLILPVRISNQFDIRRLCIKNYTQTLFYFISLSFKAFLWYNRID